jgi:hypothetical protein
MLLAGTKRSAGLDVPFLAERPGSWGSRAPGNGGITGYPAIARRLSAGGHGPDRRSLGVAKSTAHPDGP